MEELGTPWADFRQILGRVERGLQTFVEKIQVWSKSAKNNTPKTHLNVTLQAHFTFCLMLNPMVHK
jgi:hypothetical protein